MVGVFQWSQLFAFYKLWSVARKSFNGGRSQDFVWGNVTNDLSDLRLEAFRFRIGVRDFNTPSDLVRVTAALRDVADKHPDLEIISYQQSRPIADQVLLPEREKNGCS